jgi:hypothetical protein
MINKFANQDITAKVYGEVDQYSMDSELLARLPVDNAEAASAQQLPLLEF